VDPPHGDVLSRSFPDDADQVDDGVAAIEGMVPLGWTEQVAFHHGHLRIVQRSIRSLPLQGDDHVPVCQ
jgi:hypothetical protein